MNLTRRELLRTIPAALLLSACGPKEVVRPRSANEQGINVPPSIIASPTSLRAQSYEQFTTARAKATLTNFTSAEVDIISLTTAIDYFDHLAEQNPRYSSMVDTRPLTILTRDRGVAIRNFYVYDSKQQMPAIPGSVPGTPAFTTYTTTEKTSHSHVSLMQPGSALQNGYVLGINETNAGMAVEVAQGSLWTGIQGIADLDPAVGQEVLANSLGVAYALKMSGMDYPAYSKLAALGSSTFGKKTAKAVVVSEKEWLAIPKTSPIVK